MRSADNFFASHPQVLDEDQTSPEAVEKVVALTDWLAAYHRFECRGMERVPAGGCLLVANHNSGAMTEMLLLLRGWFQHWGHRPARGLAHRVVWQWPFKHLGLQKLGALIAHPAVAQRALGLGQALLVFPGGELETFRPFSERYSVTLGERTGFASLAKASGVPIVPVVICGTHAEYLVLPGARALAERIGFQQLMGVKTFPLTLGAVSVLASAAATLAFPPAAPLLVASSILAVLPLPSRVEIEVLDPVQPEPGESDRTLAARVCSKMQLAMDGLAAKRLTPWG